MSTASSPLTEGPVLVTGSRGQLGAAFADALSAAVRCVGVDVDEVDIGAEQPVRALVGDLRPRVILNCAAYNAVDGAEADPLTALRTNADGVASLATAAAACGAVFVHFSTDFVFDGTSTTPYTESDPTNPQSVYGMSKLLGERGARLCGRHYVLRLSSLYGGHTGRTFVDHILRSAAAGSPVEAFADRTVSPSYVPDVVSATLQLVGAGAPFGLYHCGSLGSCTWSELALHVLARLGRADLLRPVPFVAAAHRAARPRYCALSIRKLEEAGAQVRPWKAAADHYLSRMSGSGADDAR